MILHNRVIKQSSNLLDEFGRKGVTLTLSQKNKIEEILDEYEIIEDKSGEPSGLSLIRLTLPLFIIMWLILALIILPIKWLFTGVYYLKSRNKFTHFAFTWWNNMIK